MLEGLEIVEVKYIQAKLQNDSRLEAEYWVQNVIKNYKTVKGIEVISFVQYGTSEQLNEEKRGFPVLRLNEFDSFFIDKPTKYCENISNEEYQSLKLKKGDVLICRTNGNPKLVGKSALVPEDFEFAFASYLFKIRPRNDIINSETLVTFLNSKYGRIEINKYSMTSNQTNFSPAKFREIDIPVFNIELQHLIKDLINESYIKLKESNFLYLNSKQILLNELGLSNWQPTVENKSIKKFTESYGSSERLDAEYYQPKYDEVMKIIMENKYSTLGELVQIRKSIEPGSEAYQTEGIPFLRVANISKYEISETEIYLNEKEFNDENLKPRKDTILFSKDGSIGIAYKLEENVNAITSSALLHLKIKSNNILPDYLTLVLNSKLVQLQAERDSGGSIIQHWRMEEIKNVLIPILEMGKQIEISNEIKKSFALRKQSKELLERAKKAVEIAIEDGEEKVLDQITSNF